MTTASGQPAGAMSRRLLYLLPVALFVAVAGYFLVALFSNRNPQEVPSALVGKPAPDFTLAPLLSDLPGVARADLGGDVVLVNFFASWCVPCRAEHPYLGRLAKDGGLPIFGIAYKDKADAARAYLAQLGNPYARIGMDDSGRTGIDFGITGVPETFVVGRDGRICYRQWGPVTDADTEQALLAKIKECRG
jgi:cytochrome c biogenesis protein CcmG, thiol:disulfide interchange protein DsbE